MCMHTWYKLDFSLKDQSIFIITGCSYAMPKFAAGMQIIGKLVSLKHNSSL